MRNKRLAISLSVTSSLLLVAITVTVVVVVVTRKGDSTPATPPASPQITSTDVIPCVHDTCRNTVNVELRWEGKPGAVVTPRRNDAFLQATTNASIIDTDLAANTTYNYAIAYGGSDVWDTQTVTVGSYDEVCGQELRMDNVNGVCVAECSGHGSRNATTDACECDAGYAGDMCQHSGGATCNGNGVVNADGSCTCDASHTGATCTTHVPAQFLSSAVIPCTGVNCTMLPGKVDIQLTFTGKEGSSYTLRRPSGNVLTTATFGPTPASYTHAGRNPDSSYTFMKSNDGFVNHRH